MVPVAPSWIVATNRCIVAKLVPDHSAKRYRIEIHAGVSAAEMEEAAIRRVVDAETAIFVGALKPQDESVVTTARELDENGFEGVMLISPEGIATPPPGGRNAA